MPASAPPLRDAASVKQRILTGARKHFLAHGFRSVTMDELAAELGMSKKTLYAHFPSKGVLLETVMNQKFGEIESDLDRITSDKSRDFPAALRDLLSCVQCHAEEIRPPFVRDVRREKPELFQLVETRRRKLIQEHFGKVLNHGRKTGLIRKDLAVDLIVEILLGTVEAIVNPEKLDQFGLTPRSGFETVLSVILEGVVTEEGKTQR